MQFNQVREQLQLRRHELEARAERVTTDLRGAATPVEGGFADQAAEHSNDAVLDAIRESARVELQQIDQALRRLAEGRYDRCEDCGGRISPERLAAVPYASTCSGCAA
jgi:RNA polymerase-binding transcription factor DksA